MNQSASPSHRDVPAGLPLFAFLRFWGKARPPNDRPTPGWHPVAYHLLDVAAVMEAMLEARPVALERAARLLRIDETDALRLLMTLAGLHDLGKFAPAFQVKAPELWEDLSATLCLPQPLPGQHTEDGYALWAEVVADELSERIWEGGSHVLERLAPAVFGHHGRPVALKELRARQGFPPQALAAARECAVAVVELLCPEPIRAAPLRKSDAAIASWYVAGLMTTADWIGSGEYWFRYTEPLADDPTLSRYWNAIARPAARRAVRETGILAPPPAPRRTFAELTQLKNKSPTPLQGWAETVELPESPCLVIIEDVTGAGKTEAAQMIVHRLLTAGRIAGAFWSMPTQATANAMYERQAKVLDRFFADGADPKPSLVLAHGQQRLHGGFQSTVLRGAAAVEDGAERNDGASADNDELPGSVACAAFLADNRRAALLADVGAGTIDQALLGVLPSKFNVVRLLGLADKVLVVDEAHAYDAYMSTELEQLLRFQAALGGDAVVLSATLPQAQRRNLAGAWADGLRLGGWSAVKRSEELELQSAAYPLATVIAADGVREVPLESAEWSCRDVALCWVHDAAAALKHAEEMAAAGAAVAWIRNTVDDCLAAADALRERGVQKVLVFHARFAQCDRQAREAEVLRLFGKQSSSEERAGRVLVATQVVEQSLDLDFDAMISDLPPIDLLIQRAGRLWRHETHDEARQLRGFRRELVVLSPQRHPNPPSDWLGGSFRGTALVYRNHGVLWRTVEALHHAGEIATPDGLRVLVEKVYGAKDSPPDGLLKSTQRAEAEALSAASTAQYGTLKVTYGYDAGQEPWVNDLHVPTRLGDDYTILRLARVRRDKTLAPWSDAAPASRAWALSEVRVRRTRIPSGAAPLPQYEAAALTARREWGHFEQDLPILPLQEIAPGHYEGILVRPDRSDAIHLRYSIAEGLAFRPR